MFSLSLWKIVILSHWARSGICCVLVSLQLIFLLFFGLTKFWAHVKGWQVAENSRVYQLLWGCKILSPLFCSVHTSSLFCLASNTSWNPQGAVPPSLLRQFSLKFYRAWAYLFSFPLSNILVPYHTKALQPFSPISPIPVLLYPWLFSEKKPGWKLPVSQGQAKGCLACSIT